jgi:hypothetical protein
MAKASLGDMAVYRIRDGNISIHEVVVGAAVIVPTLK